MKIFKRNSLKFRIKARWRRRDVIMFLERLELYVGAGLTVNRALRSIEEGMKKRQKLAVSEIRESVENGSSLARVLRNYGVLSATTASLVEHGEYTGRLVSTLASARALLERQEELIKKCLSAMVYPIVIGVFAVGLTIGLVRGIMPQIIPMLRGLHVQLPLLTRIVIWTSESFLSFGTYVIGGMIIFSVGAMFAYRRATFFKSLCQSFLMKIPIAGSLIHQYSLSVFLRSCGSLIDSGVPVATAYESTTGTIALIPMRKNMQTEIPTVERGIPLGGVLSKPKLLLPSYISQLLLAGEASGALGSSAVRAANIIDRDVEHMLKRATSLIEPVMMAGMGTVVGGIALSIMMPIYDVSKVLHA